VNRTVLSFFVLKLEIAFFKKELSALKKQKTELSQRNTAAKVEVAKVEKELGKYSCANILYWLMTDMIE
jgi:regulator of replication initiation timing